MKNIYLFLALFFAFDSFAGIRVYDAQSGKEQNKEFLVKQGAAVPELGELTEDQFKNMSKQDFFKYIKQEPDSFKDIERQKVKNLGTVIFFTDVSSLSPKLSDLMNEIGEIKDVRTEFYLKNPETYAAIGLAGMKMGPDLKQKLQVDFNGDLTRRLHINSFPSMIFITKDQKISRYSGSSGGLTALKIRLGELRALEQTFSYK